MANIDKLNFSFTDGQTTITANHLNSFVDRINRLIDTVGGDTPTQTVVNPTISISGSTATISCSTSGATIRYTTNGSTPSHSVGTVISSGSSFSIPSGTTVIKAIAYKDGMNDSSVASQSYAPSDPVQTIVNKIKAKLSGVGNKETAVYNLINALGGSTPTSGIWEKITALYIPCLAVTTDEGNVFYDVKADVVQPNTNSYKIEAKRGVMPTEKNSYLGEHDTSVSADNTSMFGILTQRTDQTLGSSSGATITCNGLDIYWQSAGTKVQDSQDQTSKIIGSSISDFANTPETFVLSSASGGSRTFIINEGSVTGSLSPTATGKYRLAKSSYAAVSLFAIADGLTAAEAATISTALQTFSTAYGIECENS